MQCAEPCVQKGCNGKFTPVHHLNFFSFIILALNVGDLL